MSTRGEAEFSALVEAVYDTALDPSLWNECLSRTVQYCGADAGAGLWKNASVLTAEWFGYHQVDPNWIDLHTNVYAKYDPMAGLLLHPPGKATPMEQFICRDDLIRGQFYQEWSEPQFLHDATSVVMHRSSDEFAFVTLMNSEERGRISGEINTLLNRVAPHLSKAFKIGNVLQLRQQEKCTFAETIDGLAVAVLLVDAGGKVVHANPRARDAMLNSGCLICKRGRLMAADPRYDRQLQAALASACSGDSQNNMQGIALPLTSRRGEHFVLHTLPLAPSSRPKSGLPATPKAAVFICPVAQYTVTLPEVIRAALGLTAAELRVMLAIADIGGVPEVANELGLAVSTVKTHLGRVYGKTGLSRQADLVKLVSGFSTPLAGPPRIPQGDKLA